MTESGSEFTETGWELHFIPGQGREAWKGGLEENQGHSGWHVEILCFWLGHGAHFSKKMCF